MCVCSGARRLPGGFVPGVLTAHAPTALPIPTGHDRCLSTFTLLVPTEDKLLTDTLLEN